MGSRLSAPRFSDLFGRPVVVGGIQPGELLAGELAPEQPGDCQDGGL